MTSSKLKTRTASPSKPSLCISKPKPPVLPPPPPPPWPATAFPIHHLEDFSWYGTPFHVDETHTVTRITGTWRWEFSTPFGPNERILKWHVDELNHNARLQIAGKVNGFPFDDTILATPIAWGSAHNYAISAWDTVFPAGKTGSAFFTF